MFFIDIVLIVSLLYVTIDQLDSLYVTTDDPYVSHDSQEYMCNLAWNDHRNI